MGPSGCLHPGILAIKEATLGKLLAFGEADTYNPATGNEGLSLLQLWVYPVFPGGVREARRTFPGEFRSTITGSNLGRSQRVKKNSVSRNCTSGRSIVKMPQDASFRII